jgi:Protein of unknown function (DUF2380)
VTKRASAIAGGMLSAAVAAVVAAGHVELVSRAWSAEADAAAPQKEPPAQQQIKLAVLDIELTGDTGGEKFAAEHAARLKMASELLREELRRTGRYQALDLGPAQKLIEQLRSTHRYLYDCNGCDLDVGRLLGADQIMVVWVDRVSGLILTLTYEIHDVASGQIAARKSYDFRGDNDSAWIHAIKYMVRDLS